MRFKQEVAELCHTIHLFENNVRQLKQELFNIKFLTKKLIWNHIIGGKYKSTDGQQLNHFFKKHNINIKQDIMKIVINTYSSKKDGKMSQNDLWQIFKPMHMKAINEVNETREKRQVLSSCHETHYKVSDLLCEIMSKTVEFLKISQKMKWNIVQCEPEPFQIKPLDASHLQIYLHEYIPDLLTNQAEVVLKHIMRNELQCHKTLEEFMIPQGYRGQDANPNYVRQNQNVMEMEGVELMKYHWQNVSYVGSTIKKRPIYLEDTVDSFKGSVMKFPEFS